MPSPGFRGVNVRDDTHKLLTRLTAYLERRNRYKRRVMLADAIHIAVKEALARRKPRKKK